MLLAMILGLSLAEAQETGTSDEEEAAETSGDSESTDSAVDEATKEATEMVDRQTEALSKDIIEKSLAKPIVGAESLENVEGAKVYPEDGDEDFDGSDTDAGAEVDGVIGDADVYSGGLTWDNLTDTKEEHGFIFRPQLGVTSLKTVDRSYSGVHAGLNVGYHKYHRLGWANVGIYSRHRTLFLPTLGELSGSDIRVGSVLGVKVSALEAEAGVDVLRNAVKVRSADIEYGRSYGIATPVQAVLNFDHLKLRAKIEPRWYADSSREKIDWVEHRELTTLPIQALGHEFAWAVGAKIGWFGLSYEQVHMDQGIQSTVSLGLQR